MTSAFFLVASYQSPFQSTSPVGGMTQLLHLLLGIPLISIHIPRGGDDAYLDMGPPSPRRFQSTSPVGGMTT